MKLTDPQREALKLLLIEPRETSKTTACGWVAGTVMQALERKKLAERIPRPVTEVLSASAWSSSKYRITDAGKAALGGNPHVLEGAHAIGEDLGDHEEMP